MVLTSCETFVVLQSRFRLTRRLAEWVKCGEPWKRRELKRKPSITRIIAASSLLFNAYAL